MLSLIKISYRVLSLESRVANSSVCVLYSRSRSNILYCAGYTGKYTDASWLGPLLYEKNTRILRGVYFVPSVPMGNKLNRRTVICYMSVGLWRFSTTTVQINMQINDLLTSGKDPYIMTPSVYPPILWKTSEKYPKYCCFYRKIRGNPRNSLQVEEIKSTEIGNCDSRRGESIFGTSRFYGYFTDSHGSYLQLYQSSHILSHTHVISNGEHHAMIITVIK